MRQKKEKIFFLSSMKTIDRYCFIIIIRYFLGTF